MFSKSFGSLFQCATCAPSVIFRLSSRNVVRRTILIASNWRSLNNIATSFKNHAIVNAMSGATAIEVLKLYRNLLRYGRELKLTDKNYFKDRIRQEFQQNKSLESETEIKFNIEVSKLVECLWPKTTYSLVRLWFLRTCLERIWIFEAETSCIND